MNSIIIYSYRKYWHFKKKMYSFLGFRFGFGLDLTNVLYLIVGLGMVALINLVPIIRGIPILIKWGVIPFLIMKFLSSVRLDGKNPIKYFIGCIYYLINTHEKTYEHFRKAKTPETLIFSWAIGTRIENQKKYTKLNLSWIVGSKGGYRCISVQ
jgi:hypothetical protein